MSIIVDSKVTGKMTFDKYSNNCKNNLVNCVYKIKRGAMVMKKNEMTPPEGKKFYGSVTVSERGQMVIPAEARKDFNIGVGDKVLVFGDMKMGIWIATFGILEKNMQGSVELFRDIEARMKDSV